MNGCYNCRNSSFSRWVTSAPVTPKPTPCAGVHPHPGAGQGVLCPDRLPCHAQSLVGWRRQRHPQGIHLPPTPWTLNSGALTLPGLMQPGARSSPHTAPQRRVTVLADEHAGERSRIHQAGFRALQMYITLLHEVLLARLYHALSLQTASIMQHPCHQSQAAASFKLEDQTCGSSRHVSGLELIKAAGLAASLCDCRTALLRILTGCVCR